MKVSSFGWLALTLTIAIWSAAGILWQKSHSVPITYLGGDTVEPKVVKHGGEVTITRHMKFLRVEDVRVARTMISGDCKKRCEIVELPSSQLATSPSDNIVRARDLIIPLGTTPGKWRLVFAMQWRGMFGRMQTELLPELEIEVIQ